MALGLIQNFTGTGSITNYQIVGDILSKNHVAVWFDDNSIRENPNTYDVFGNTIIFKIAPSSGVTIKVAVSDDGEGLEVVPNSITSLYENIDKIDSVYENIEEVVAVGTELINYNTIETVGTDLLLGSESEIRKVNLAKSNIDILADLTDEIEDVAQNLGSISLVATDLSMAGIVDVMDAGSITAPVTQELQGNSLLRVIGDEMLATDNIENVGADLQLGINSEIRKVNLLQPDIESILAIESKLDDVIALDDRIIDVTSEPLRQSIIDAEANIQTAIDKAAEASVSASNALSQANISTAQAVISTNQAVISTAQAVISNDKSVIATNQATIATTQAGISTTQAGISTTKASEALISANASEVSNLASYDSAVDSASSASASLNSANNSSASATSSHNSEVVALAQAAIATSQAATATSQANTATTQANIAITQAGNALTSANNADASEALALSYKNDASDSADASTTSATNSYNSYLDSLDSANTSITQAGISTTKAVESNTSAVNALASENKANLWAEEDEDVEVETDAYSAKHWAIKAQELVSNGIIDDTEPLTTKVYSSQRTLDLHNAQATTIASLAGASCSFYNNSTQPIPEDPSAFVSLTWTNNQASTNSDVFELGTNSIIFKKNGVYNFLSSLTFYRLNSSATAIITFEIYRTSDNVTIQSYSQSIDMDSGTKMTVPMNSLLVINDVVGTEEIRVRMRSTSVNGSIEMYNFNSFLSLSSITSSATTDIMNESLGAEVTGVLV